MTAFTYYRWCKEFGGLKSDQAKRLKDLEKENERLRDDLFGLVLLLRHSGFLQRLKSLLHGGPLFRGQAKAARKSLYGQAQRECAALSEQFNKADCRLGALSINLNNFVSQPNNPQPPQPMASASYLLKMK